MLNPCWCLKVVSTISHGSRGHAHLFEKHFAYLLIELDLQPAIPLVMSACMSLISTVFDQTSQVHSSPQTWYGWLRVQQDKLFNYGFS